MPMTPQQATRRRSLNKKIIMFFVVPVFTLLAIVIAIVATSGNSPEEDTEKPSTSQADRDKAREAAGLPPGPDEATATAYIQALNAIDPRIVKPGKDDRAVSRGLTQCGSIKASPDDRDKLVQSTLGRFTIDTRLPDINTPDTGAKILDVVHKYLCPDF